MTSFPALGTTASILVTHPNRLPMATALLRSSLEAIDATCSRFRADSEISQLPPGRPTEVSPLLASAIEVALRSARLTDGLVDPTVGGAMRALGYDRDFASIVDGPATVAPVPGWHRIMLDRQTVVVPRDVHLDLGATAKALAADKAAQLIARNLRCGVLVNLGGDVSIAGPGLWDVAVADDHANAVAHPDTTVVLCGGGLATSGITRRHWQRAGRTINHIIDPRTGDTVPPYWRTVTVAAKSCVDANTASTAAIVLGANALEWLAARHLPARLVSVTGEVWTTPRWPMREAA
jgi:thiamine biosynthesis lipoprotein